MYTNKELDVPPSVSESNFNIDDKLGNNFEKMTSATSDFVNGLDSLAKIRNTLLFVAGVVTIGMLGWIGYRVTEIYSIEKTVSLQTNVFVTKTEDSQCVMWKINQGNYSYVVEKDLGYNEEAGVTIKKIALLKAFPQKDLISICEKLKEK